MAVRNAQLPTRARSTRFLPLAVAWQITVVVVLLLITMMKWWAFLLAGLVLLVMLLLSAPVNGRSLLNTIKLRARYSARQRNFVADPDVPELLVPLAQWLPRLVITETTNVRGGEIGVVADSQSWVGVLEVTSDDALLADRGAEINLDLLRSLTDQDDVVFAGVQVLNLTVPGPNQALLTPGSLANRAYLEITGERPTPPAVRRTWVALRLDPRLCLEAVDRRGSGQAGVMATLRFGLHRAQAQLKRQGVVARALDSGKLAEVLALTTGAELDEGAEGSRELWKQWHCGDLVHETRNIRSFGTNPAANYQALLDGLAQSPTMMVLTSFTVAPGEPPRGAVRQITPTQEAADAADEELIHEMGGSLRFGPLGGIQVPGLLATLPLGRQVH